MQLLELELNPPYSLPGSLENFKCALESRGDLQYPEVLRIKIIKEIDVQNNCMRLF